MRSLSSKYIVASPKPQLLPKPSPSLAAELFEYLRTHKLIVALPAIVMALLLGLLLVLEAFVPLGLEG